MSKITSVGYIKLIKWSKNGIIILGMFAFHLYLGGHFMRKAKTHRRNKIILYILTGIIVFSTGFIHYSAQSNAEDYSEKPQAVESAPAESSTPTAVVLKSVHSSTNPHTGAVDAHLEVIEPEEPEETTVETEPAPQEEAQTEEVETELVLVETETVYAELEPEAEEIDYSSTETDSEYAWDGPVLNAYVGTVTGPSGKETYYNLDMSGIVSSIQNHTWLWNDIAPEYRDNVTGEYWIRDDGVKMLGDYIMVAANLDVHPRGTLVETSLGIGVVVDTGGFASSNAQQLDIAVNW